MRIRTLTTTLVLAAAGLIGLGGCHDGFSSIGYSYYGSYGSPCDSPPGDYGYRYDYGYCPPASSYSFRYNSGYGGHGHSHGGFRGGHHGGHGGRGHY